MKEVKYVKNVLFALIIMISISTLNACSQSNEQKREKAVIKIEKCISNHQYDKANEIVETIPDEFETEKKEYRHKIMTSRIKYDFKEVFSHGYKVRALTDNAEILYQYVGGEFLLSEVLALAEFRRNKRGFDVYEKERIEQRDNVLKRIAMCSAYDGEYQIAYRCLTEITEKSDAYKEARNKIESCKLADDIETEFNAAKFSKGSSILNERAKNALNKLVQVLKKDKTFSVSFIGHTSADGSDEMNLQLSKDRAKAAAKYIESKGIDGIRIYSEGKGSSQLLNKIDPTSDENCRIDIVLLNQLPVDIENWELDEPPTYPIGYIILNYSLLILVIAGIVWGIVALVKRKRKQSNKKSNHYE